MKKLVFLALALAVLLCALVFSAQQEIDLAGTWVGNTIVPSGETDELTLVLEKDPEGYKGKISDSLGLVTEAGIYNCAFKDGKMTFNFSLNDGAEISTEFALTEGKLVGTWSHPEGSSGSAELVRK